MHATVSDSGARNRRAHRLCDEWCRWWIGRIVGVAVDIAIIDVDIIVIFVVGVGAGDDHRWANVVAKIVQSPLLAAIVAKCGAILAAVDAGVVRVAEAVASPWILGIRL